MHNRHNWNDILCFKKILKRPQKLDKNILSSKVFVVINGENKRLIAILIK